MVCSPGAIPRQPGDQIKTDTRDALKLARLLAAGQLRPVVVPVAELEALRDLVRAREDLRGDLIGARHRISKLLLRRGLVFDGPGETWSRRHLQWRSTVRFGQPLVEVVFGEYLAHHEVLLARRDRLDRLLAEQSVQGPWAPTVARLRCLRGVDTLTAVGLIAEIGDISAFRHPNPAGQLPRPGRVRAVLRRTATAGPDHQGRQQPRAPPARRSRLALPSRAARLADAQAPPSRPAARRDRRRVARPDTTTSPLDAPRRRTRQEAHNRRGRRRTRARVLCLGDRPTTRLTHDHDPVARWGWRPAQRQRDPRCSYEHQPRLARSILDRGPGAAQKPS